MSQCDVHDVMTWPFTSSRPARSSYCFGSKITDPFELPAPILDRTPEPSAARQTSRRQARHRARAAAESTRLTSSSTCQRRNHAVRPAGPVDNRRRGDADFRHDLRAASRVTRGLADADERGPPEHGARDGVHRVDRVVLSGHIQHIVHAAAGNGDGGQVERLRIHLAVDREESVLPNVVALTIAGVRIVSFRF